MKKILVCGELGYHEETMVNPVLRELSKYYEFDRIGGNFDFFVKANHDTIRENYLSAIPEFQKLKDYDAVFFVDYWNPIVPMFQFARWMFNPKLKFIGYSLGGVAIPNDVAHAIEGSQYYEDYLNRIFDLLIVARQFHLDLIGDTGRDNLKLLSHPIERSTEVDIPDFKYRNLVIYAHRYNFDKGCDTFEDFVKLSRERNSDIEFVVCGLNSEEAVQRIQDLGVEYLGYLSQDELRELASNGGYAWSSVHSELMGYAVSDLVSYGCTPIINNHPAYYNYPDRFKYATLEDAIDMIENRVVMTPDEWLSYANSERGNAENIVNEINRLLDV